MRMSRRFTLLAALFALSLITYIDRASISSVKDALTADLALTDAQVGVVFGAFALGYALAQIPAGWLADRIGPRYLLAGIVVLWSGFTALTGMLTGYVPLLVTRFLFGVAEAGAFPGAARAIYERLSVAERGLAHGVIFAGSRLGAALAFPLMAALLATWNWRSIFLILALPGLAWAAAWFVFYRGANIASSAAAAVPAPARLPAPAIPRGRLALTMLQYFIVNFTTFLCLSWMLPYLKAKFALSPQEGAFYTMIPLLIGTAAQWATGVTVDRLYRGETLRTWSRRLPAATGFLISAAGAAMIPSASDITWATVWFSVAALGAEMVISPSWSYCLDLGGARSGAVSGAMNMAGNLGSFTCASIFPLVASWTGSQDDYFRGLAALDLVAAACWIRLHSEPRTTAG